MRRLLLCEFRKLKRRRLLSAAALSAVLMPALYTMLLRDATLDDLMSVVREESGLLLLVPLSVVIAANLFFQEHDDNTLKNLLCIPISRGRLAIAKLLVLLLFDLFYLAAGFAVALALAAARGLPPAGLGVQLLLTLGTAVLAWAASLPCVLLVVWFDRSYIISVVIAFAYTVLGFLMRINDLFMMVPLGLNLPTVLPFPMMMRWLYQFHPMEGVGGETLAFYQRFRPYFVPTPVIFAVLLCEAAVFAALVAAVYSRQDV